MHSRSTYSQLSLVRWRVGQRSVIGACCIAACLRARPRHQQSLLLVGRIAPSTAAPDLDRAVHAGRHHASALGVCGDAADGAPVRLEAEHHVGIHQLPVADAACARKGRCRARVGSLQLCDTINVPRKMHTCKSITSSQCQPSALGNPQPATCPLTTPLRPNHSPSSLAPITNASPGMSAQPSLMPVCVWPL